MAIEIPRALEDLDRPAWGSPRWKLLRTSLTPALDHLAGLQLSLVVAASLSLLYFADTWGMHDSDVGTGWMIVMMIGMALFWGLIILGIVWLVRSAPGAHQAQGSPLEILDRRFASGEMSVEEYRERRNVLRDGED